MFRFINKLFGSESIQSPKKARSSGKKRRDRDRCRPQVEALEDRRLMSTIVWTNRGDDNFNSLTLLGSTPSVSKARQVVDAAISYWSQVIQDFHWDDSDITQFDLTIEVDTLEGGIRAETSGDHDDGDDTPYAATITIDSDAAGAGWWIDGTPRDNSEFLSNIVERDVAFGSFTSGNDMLRTVMHEIGHAMGISESADGFEADDLKIGDFLKETDEEDPRGDGDSLEVFAGSTAAGSLRVAFTDFGGLHIYNTFVDYDGKRYFGANDLMNSGADSPDNSRKLISDLDARILEAAYGYTVKLPSTILGLSYLADRTTTGLTVLNDPEDFGDDYYLVRSGNNRQLTVNGAVINVPVTAAAPLPAITFKSTDEYGEIELDFSGGDLTSGEVKIYAAGVGDILRIRSGAAGNTFVLTGDTLTVTGGGVNDTVKLSGVEELVFITGMGTNTITVNSTPAGLKSLHLNGGGGVDKVVVESVSAGVSVSLNGGAGNDNLRVGTVPAGTVSLVDGGANSDSVVVGKANNTLNSILGELYVFGGQGTGDALVLKDYGMILSKSFNLKSTGITRNGMGKVTWAYSESGSSGFESIGVQGGGGNDTFKIESVPNNSSVTLGGGNGSDTIIGPDTDGGYLPNFWTITALNKGTFNGLTFTAENLTGGAGGDLFKFNAGTSVTGKIDGGSGTDALDYQAFTTDVVVNLWTSTATGAGGGISHIEQVIGGAGNDVLVGNSLENSLYGMNGRDILIGGLGADVLKGGGGEDILIADTTSYDSNPVALGFLIGKWKTSYLPYSSRVSSLRTGVGPSSQYKLTTATVSAYHSADKLTGELDKDWFWASLSMIQDKASNESVGMS